MAARPPAARSGTPQRMIANPSAHDPARLAPLMTRGTGEPCPRRATPLPTGPTETGPRLPTTGHQARPESTGHRGSAPPDHETGPRPLRSRPPRTQNAPAAAEVVADR
jgi:hypothetical protein